jgi:hypothetical protein
MIELEDGSMTRRRREIRTRRQEIHYPELGVQERRRLALNRMSSNERGVTYLYDPMEFSRMF